MSSHVEALAFKVWRESILNVICAADFKWGEHNFHIIRRIRAKVAHFEGELPKLKEITTILELALWKMRINQANETHRLRQQCRTTCGADVVIRHVLPYIITAAGEE